MTIAAATKTTKLQWKARVGKSQTGTSRTAAPRIVVLPPAIDQPSLALFFSSLCPNFGHLACLSVEMRPCGMGKASHLGYWT
ncbi:hypothetical protein [Azospirillum soli]|uniref:hypothetical protein n=1 Tax=Azospirillum soli TaxID=1304799 RepID=UPI001AE4EEFE|nr:hypothetical protein [Azospirillum soli]MBP2313346.1 hypothetical protein [Azospirillum soli]